MKLTTSSLGLFLLATSALAIAGSSPEEPAPSGRGQRGLADKADHPSGSCLASCGGQSESGGCYCDELCESYGDCCSDYETVCQSPTCGGFIGAACADDEFCAFPASATCGWADATGTCQARPDFCPEVYSPVCGCDGSTYDNECFANAAGTAILSSGECGSEPPPPAPPQPAPGATCEGACGGQSDNGCWCDESCSAYGDCCDDYDSVCAAERTPASGMCVRNSGDECETDADCMPGGCGGELCFNPEGSSGISTCDCTAPTAVSGCGCVAGSCSWYN